MRNRPVLIPERFRKGFLLRLDCTPGGVQSHLATLPPLQGLSLSPFPYPLVLRDGVFQSSQSTIRNAPSFSLVCRLVVAHPSCSCQECDKMVSYYLSIYVRVNDEYTYADIYERYAIVSFLWN
ncbi:hypothetical protein HNY73_016617 [Argiope bruennichi]|uniref:Uncharacterized protein n=1 Tax=Argiope bruennichi TaxID=94029 RepID=A0A8T0EKR2_ARGBR|nr:hypothetical protein HNY73_016617 [Argiope bruennichi]